MGHRRRVTLYEPEIPPQANIIFADDPPTGPLRSIQVAEVEDARFLLTIESAPSRSRASTQIFEAVVDNPQLNEPVRLEGGGITPDLDMVPVVVRLRLLSGSAAAFQDAIIAVRIRRRRRSFHEEA